MTEATPDASTASATPPTATTASAPLSVADIEKLIPHRWPFLLVDRIVEYDPEARRIVGIKAVTATEWFFQGHFPGLPVVPGVIQVEALAQTMAVYVARQPGFGDRIGLFAGIDEVRFKRVVVPGDTLRLEVTMEKLGSRFGKGRAVAIRRWRGGLRRPRLLRDPPGGGPAMTRLAALSDIHGNATAMEAVLKDIAREKPDAVLVAGDLVLNGPEPALVVDVLQEPRGRRRPRHRRQHGHRRGRLRLQRRLPVDDRWRPRRHRGRRGMGARRTGRRPHRLAAPPARPSDAGAPTTLTTRSCSCATAHPGRRPRASTRAWTRT